MRLLGATAVVPLVRESAPAEASSRRVVGGLVGAALSIALLTSCGDDVTRGESSNGASGGEVSTSTTEALQDSDEAARQEVIAALLAAEEAAGEAFAPPTPDPEHPDLLATHTGPMLEQRQMVATRLALEGRAIKLPEDTRFRVEVESVEFDPERPDVAILTTCVVDDGVRHVVATGEVIADGVASGEFTDAMQRVDGVWKLAERREERRWTGEAGCAVE